MDVQISHSILWDISRVKCTDDIKRALWAGANTFRDNIDASNYKDYVLSMFFVKYLSDTFDESVKELEKEYTGIRLERQILNLPFFLKKEYTFDYLLENQYAPDLGTKISKALTGIESSNAILSGIFRGIDFNSESNLGKKEQKNPILRNLLNDFADLDLHPSNIDVKEEQMPADIIGDAYEYMIGEFATMAGKKAGSFFTPQQVSEIMAQIVHPIENDRVYDKTVPRLIQSIHKIPLISRLFQDIRPTRSYFFCPFADCRILTLGATLNELYKIERS
ncbi:MAG: SAM-dependent DNA methyltransferase [Firmicutes bacterium]|nr:SAM-dependent DNA methyltransferase [Bacillota bacterium]